MLNQVMAQDLFSNGQLDRMMRLLDEWLRIYTGAVFVLFVAVIAVLAWAVFCEARESKATKKIPSNHPSFQEHQLLRTEP
jgi:hypothetical protein